MIGQGGESIYSWKGSYRSDNTHDFNIVVQQNGWYIIKVTHHSNYRKVLTMKVSPGSWQYEE